MVKSRAALITAMHTRTLATYLQYGAMTPDGKQHEHMSELLTVTCFYDTHYLPFHIGRLYFHASLYNT
jgi:hypothetical protein